MYMRGAVCCCWGVLARRCHGTCGSRCTCEAPYAGRASKMSAAGGPGTPMYMRITMYMRGAVCCCWGVLARRCHGTCGSRCTSDSEAPSAAAGESWHADVTVHADHDVNTSTRRRLLLLGSPGTPMSRYMRITMYKRLGGAICCCWGSPGTPMYMRITMYMRGAVCCCWGVLAPCPGRISTTSSKRFTEPPILN
jgi:hypothetical protein